MLTRSRRDLRRAASVHRLLYPRSKASIRGREPCLVSPGSVRKRIAPGDANLQRVSEGTRRCAGEPGGRAAVLQLQTDGPPVHLTAKALRLTSGRRIRFSVVVATVLLASCLFGGAPLAQAA